MHAPPAVSIGRHGRGQLRHFQPVAAQRLGAVQRLVGGRQPWARAGASCSYCASPMLTVAGMPRLSTRLDSVSAKRRATSSPSATARRASLPASTAANSSPPMRASSTAGPSTPRAMSAKDEHQIAGLVAVAVVDGLELVRSKASTASGSRPGRRRSGAGPARRTSGGCPAGSGSRSAIPAAAGHASLRAPASSVMGSTMEYSTPSYMVILLASICAAGHPWPPTRAG